MTPELQKAVDAYQARQNASRLLSEAVREARKQHSLTEIAQQLGVSRQRVFQISEGK